MTPLLQRFCRTFRTRSTDTCTCAVSRGLIVGTQGRRRPGAHGAVRGSPVSDWYSLAVCTPRRISGRRRARRLSPEQPGSTICPRSLGAAGCAEVPDPAVRRGDRALGRRGRPAPLAVQRRDYGPRRRIVNARLDAAEGNVRVGVIQGIGNLSQLRHALVTPHRLSPAIAYTRLHLLP